MGSEGVEVQVEAVTREGWGATGSQDGCDRVDEGMVLVTGSKATHTQRSCVLWRKEVNNSFNWR